MAKPNPVNPLVDAFSRDWLKLGSAIERAMRKRMRAGQSPRVAVRGAFRDVGVQGKIEAAVVNSVAAAVTKGSALVIVDKKGFTNWYLHKHWPGDKLSLSKRLAKLNVRSAIVDTIESQLRQNKSFTQLAKALTDKTLVTGEVAGHIQQVDRLARKVAAGDKALLKEFQRELKASRKSIEGLAQAGAPTQRLKKSYARVLRAAESLNVARMDKAITAAVRSKARYTAERIARTEIARAYGVGMTTKAMDDPDVKAIRWVLNSRHPVFDICDVHAETDQFGLGEGGYPIKAFPDYPAHPNCLCLIEEIFGAKEPTVQKPKKVQSFIKKLPVQKQKQLLGVKGRTKFLKNPSTWRRELKSYQGTRLPERMPKMLYAKDPTDYATKLLNKGGATHATIVSKVNKAFPGDKGYTVRRLQRLKKRNTKGGA